MRFVFDLPTKINIEQTYMDVIDESDIVKEHLAGIERVLSGLGLTATITMSIRKIDR